MTESTTIVPSFVIGTLFCQSLFTFAFAHHSLKSNKAATPLMGLALGFVAFSLSPILSTPWQSVGVFFESLLPLWFWLFCKTLFDDNCGVRNLLWSAVAPFTLSALRFLQPFPGFSESIVHTMKWMHLAIIITTFWPILSDYKSDLINARRTLRLLALVFGGAALFCAIFFDFYDLKNRDLTSKSSLTINIALAAVLFVANICLIKFSDVLNPRKKSETMKVNQKITPAPAEDPIMKRIELAMTQKQFYKQEGLSLTDLAKHTSLPEYRLRQCISQNLGYKNFNHFVNHYRVGAAKIMMSSDSNRNDKIISISMEAGFASLATFNRVFKEQTGLTPSEFKARNNSSPKD
jgi:AraC-like DNA-binding protein